MICIEHAKLVLENGIIWDGTLLVEGDRIAAMGDAAEVVIPENAQRIDAKGAYVGPGFVDIHVHGGGESMFTVDPEGAAAHFLAHGETSILATLYYDLGREEFLEAIDRIVSAMHNGDAAKAICGMYMEGPYMNPKYGASPEKNKWKGEIRAEDYTQLVDKAAEHAKVWAVAPERDGLEPFMAYAKRVNPQVVFAVGHSEATPAQIRKLKKYGIRIQTHCMNATGRRSREMGVRGCGPDEACLQDGEMYAELISDSMGIHVCPDLQRLILRVKGIDRLVLISDAFVSNEEAPEDLKHVKDLCFDANGSLCGSRLTLDEACRNLMHHTGCGIAQAFLAASRNPARVLGMDDEIGSLEVGKKANLVFVDDMFNVQKVMLAGVFRA